MLRTKAPEFAIAADAEFFLNRFGHRLRVDARTGGPFVGWWIQQRGQWRPDVRGEVRWLVIQAMREARRGTDRPEQGVQYVGFVLAEAKRTVNLLTFDEWQNVA